MKPFICGFWHAWQGTSKVMLSDESVKKIREFETMDDCINWLYVNGFKDVAKSLHKHVKDNSCTIPKAM